MEEEETLRGQGCEDKESPQFSLIHELRVQESGPLAAMGEPKGLKACLPGTISYSKPWLVLIISGNSSALLNYSLPLVPLLRNRKCLQGFEYDVQRVEFGLKPT